MWNSFRKQSLTWRLYLHGLRCLIWIIFRYHHFKVKAPSGTPFIVRKEAYNEYDPFALAWLIPAELELIPEPLRKMAIYSKSNRLRAVSLFLQVLVRAMHTRGSGEAARHAKRGRQLFSCLTRLAPSVTRVAICVSRILLDGLQKKERLLVVYKSKRKSYTLEDVRGSQIGRIQYFLNRELSYLLECGKISRIEG